MSNKKEPWKILNKEKVYSNPWIEVYHHDVLNPSGEKGVYGTVEFENIAVGIIPVDDKNCTYLVGQHRFPLNSYSWEIPEGGCKLTSDPLNTAKRELLEETGITSKNWKELQKIHTSNSVTNEFGIIYTAEDLQFQESQPDSDEDLVVKKVSLKKALSLVKNGEITDSLSIAGILRLYYERPQLFN